MWNGEWKKPLSPDEVEAMDRQFAPMLKDLRRIADELAAKYGRGESTMKPIGIIVVHVLPPGFPYL